jgi:hypothetical protein
VATIELLCRATGLSPGEVVDLRERTPTVEVTSPARRARKLTSDLAFALHTHDADVLLLALVEVQLSWDPTKRWDWPLMYTAFAAAARRPAQLLVLTPSRALRERYRRTMFPKLVPCPIQIRPDQFPLITDVAIARRQPREAVLGVLFHVEDDTPLERGVAGIRAAYLGLEALDDWEALRYDLLMRSLNPRELTQHALERMRERGELDEARTYVISEVERAGYMYHRVKELAEADGLTRGLEQGLEQGRVQTLRAVLVDVLQLRGFEPSAEHRGAIDACGQLDVLERWYAAARTWPRDRPLGELLS